MTAIQWQNIFNYMVNQLSPPIDLVFSALADPTRRGMLAQLSLGASSVSELAAPYRMSLAAASKHISVLEGAGLVTKSKRGRVVDCRLNAAPLKQALDWISRYRRFWSEQLDSLEDYLEQTDPRNEP